MYRPHRAINRYKPIEFVLVVGVEDEDWSYSSHPGFTSTHEVLDHVREYLDTWFEDGRVWGGEALRIRPKLRRKAEYEHGPEWDGY